MDLQQMHQPITLQQHGGRDYLQSSLQGVKFILIMASQQLPSLASPDLLAAPIKVGSWNLNCHLSFAAIYKTRPQLFR